MRKKAKALSKLSNDPVRIIPLSSDITNRYFSGTIDQVHFYNRALSATETTNNVIYANGNLQDPTIVSTTSSYATGPAPWFDPRASGGIPQPIFYTAYLGAAP